jgi:SAM-dependent methyltransferase
MSTRLVRSLPPAGLGQAGCGRCHTRLMGGTREQRETRRSYDDIAEDYADNLGSELAGKPLDRALLDALAELAGGGLVADVGAGPGHVAGYLARRGASVVSTDLSPRMCALAAEREGLPAFASDMCALPMRSGALAGIVCFYAVIHLDEAARRRAYQEFARVLRDGGHALIAFHTSDAETPAGASRSTAQMMGHDVELNFRFIDPAAEADLLAAAGLAVTARLERAPHPGSEHASRRSYLLARRDGQDSAVE